MNKKNIYFDHNATTPLREKVREAIEPYLSEKFGNPSSLHEPGRLAKKGLEQAREQIAQLLGAEPETIFFTSGGTEANNLAISGVARFARKKNKGNHLVTTAIEHDSVLSTCRTLKDEEGFDLTILPVDKTGRVDVNEVRQALRPDTILVSIMMANNEIGTLQPIEECGHLLREKNILFHTDAVQAISSQEIKNQQVDLLTLSGHKIGALKGVGALYVRSGIRLVPLFHGGEQEMTLRSGTENIIGAVSLGAASELVSHEIKELCNLRDQLWEGIKSSIEGVHLNGHPTERLPHTLSVSFEGAEGEAVLLALDMEGIAASSGSACASGSVEPSHVLQALRLSEELAQNTIRFSLGPSNSEEEVQEVLKVLPKIISRVRLANQVA